MYQNVVKRWLSSSKVSQELKNEILKMNDGELAIAFDSAPLAFGTAGIRTKMGPGTQYLNKFTYYQMAKGYGLFLKKHFKNQEISVIVAHDNRNHGVAFSQNVCDMLTSLGIKVILFDNNDLASTPIVSYAIRETGANGAVIVTASHNPKEDNGFKVYDSTGGQLLPDDGKKVIEEMPTSEEILDLEVTPNDELISFFDETIFEKYFKAVKQSLVKTDSRMIKDYKIIFSGQHGTASKRLPLFLKSLGYTEVICVKEQCEYDGDFTYTESPNPENRSAWTLSLKYADYYNAKVIIQVDPDADRFAMAVKHNSKWRFLTGNEMGIIYTYYVLNNKKLQKIPYVVSSYVSTNLIDRIIKPFNGNVYRVGTGFKWMGAKINEIGDRQEFIVAFEEAIGALNCTINRDKDAYQAAALALEIYDYCLNKNINLVDYLEKEIYGKFGTIYNSTVAFSFKEHNWKELAESRMDQLKNYDELSIGDRKINSIVWNDIGGCLDWILDGDSWIRFRMSGTEPKFKVYYNLYGNKLSELQEEANAIDLKLRNLLNLK